MKHKAALQTLISSGVMHARTHNYLLDALLFFAGEGKGLCVMNEWLKRL